VRILLLTPSMSSRMGGSVASIGSLAKALSREHAVEVWTTDHDFQHCDPTVGDICHIRVFQLASERFFLAPGMLTALITGANRFDAVNVFHFWTLTGLLGGLVLPILEVPSFIHTQGIFLPVALRHHGRRKQLARLLGASRLLSRFTSAIVCNAVEIPSIRKWGSPRAIHVLRNPVIPVHTERGAIRSQLGLSDDIRVV
jgi:glycosyltransferase involved in cell wall biosynthesis